MKSSNKFKFGDKVLIVKGDLSDAWEHLYTIDFKIIKTEMGENKSISLLYIEDHNIISETDILPALPKWSESYINEKLFRLDKRRIIAVRNNLLKLNHKAIRENKINNLLEDELQR